MHGKFVTVAVPPRALFKMQRLARVAAYHVDWYSRPLRAAVQHDLEHGHASWFCSQTKHNSRYKLPVVLFLVEQKLLAHVRFYVRGITDKRTHANHLPIHNNAPITAMIKPANIHRSIGHAVPVTLSHFEQYEIITSVSVSVSVSDT